MQESPKQLSKTAEKNLKTLWNKLFPKDKKSFQTINLDWVVNNHENLYKICMDDKFTDDTKKTYLSAIVSALELIGNKSLVAKYKPIREQVQSKIDQKYGDNEKTVKHIGTYEEFIKKRNQLKSTRLKSYRDNLKYLITCLYTYQYPLRTEWRTVQVRNELIENFKRKDNHNYLMLNKDGKMIISLGTFKSKAHEPIDLEINDTLQDIMFESLNKYPRVNLFAKENDFNKYLQYEQYTEIMNDIGFGDERNYRSMRYSYEARTKNMTQNQKKEIARLMRTSIDKLDNVYRKIEAPTKPPKNPKLDECMKLFQKLNYKQCPISKPELPPPIKKKVKVEPEPKVETKPASRSEYMREYRKKTMTDEKRKIDAERKRLERHAKKST